MSGQDGDLIHLERHGKPEAVLEAEHSVHKLGRDLLLTGLGGAGFWILHAVLLGFPLIPLAWLAIFLAALVLFFFFPQTRQARLARELLSRWDEVQIQGLLEASCASTDPRQRAASQMARRIAVHPEATDELTAVSSDLLGALRQTAHDERLVRLMVEGPARSGEGNTPDFHLTDLLATLEARAGRLLASLAELHSAVIKRDAQSVSRILAEASQALEELRSLHEVDRLLLDSDE